MDRTHHLEGFLIVAILIGLGGLYLWQNNQPAVTVAVPAATPTSGDAPRADWQASLEAQLAIAGTTQPTPDLNMTAFVPPTLPPTHDSATVIALEQITVSPWPTLTPRPTDPPVAITGASPYPSPTGILVPDSGDAIGYAPPPEQVPLSSHANDHFWFVRPVDASANSNSLFYYTFGSDGPQNDYRVHHGVDMPNPVGEPIRAGGSGTVVFADNGGKLLETTDIDIYPSYGQVVVIEHDFGYRGQKLYTLYAHMASILVAEDQRVDAGQIIGLIGGTGDVSGPHVHMEVRVGENKYFAVQNPLLWIAPYLDHGVVAGRITGLDGEPVDDVLVTLSQRGRVIQTTTTYILPKKTPDQRNGWHVVPDSAWHENFAIGDVPQGEYEISVTLYGQRLSERITVTAGTTNFVTLGWDAPATPQAVTEDGTTP